MPSPSPASTDVVILCGGRGTRLQGVVQDRPKPMADVAGRPFLDFLVDQAASAGFRRIVLGAGYKGEQIRKRYEGTWGAVAVEVAIEPEPLGTGGGLRHALGAAWSDPVLVMNGDSFCGEDLSAFLRYYVRKEASAAMVLVRSGEERYGRVEMDPSGAVRSFREKEKGAETGYVNAGLYLLSRGTVLRIPAGRASSLEREVFPALSGSGLYGMPSEADFIDIGLPESYAAAQGILRSRTSRIGLRFERP